MSYTIKQIMESEIISYNLIQKGPGFYLIDYHVDDEGMPSEFGRVSIWANQFDDNPTYIDINDAPTDKWMHNDDCQCDDCIYPTDDEDGAN